jgi:hypothetical protein
MRREVRRVYEVHFSSMQAIVNTAISILIRNVFQYEVRRTSYSSQRVELLVKDRPSSKMKERTP